MKYIIRNTQASILIVLLLILIVLSVITVTAASFVYNHLIIVKAEENYQQAYYLAQSGANSAYEDILSVVTQVHQSILSEYGWDPITSPLKSLQEDTSAFIASALETRLKNTLVSLRYISPHKYNRQPLLTLKSGEEIKVEVFFTNSIHPNPIRLTIRSIGSIGKIKRRVDIRLAVHKVSTVIDSVLFDKAMISGGVVTIMPGAKLVLEGDIFPVGGIRVADGATAIIQGSTFTNGDIHISSGAQGTFGTDLICGSLFISGCITVKGDTYTYGGVEVIGPNSSFVNQGDIYTIGNNLTSMINGISASQGGRIILEGEIYINGTIGYTQQDMPLFGLEDLLDANDLFESGESVGGANHDFYFFQQASAYTENVFNPTYYTMDNMLKADALYNYIQQTPESIEDIAAYHDHLQYYEQSGITLHESASSKGYARGVVIANGTTLLKRDTEQFYGLTPQGTPEAFFNKIRSYMDTRSLWHFNHHIDSRESLAEYNINRELHILSPDQPNTAMLFVQSDDADLILSEGVYHGIIYTKGSIIIREGERVELHGLIISEKDIQVFGELEVCHNKKVLLQVVDQIGSPLRQFFKITTELPLIETLSWRERLINEVN